MAPKEILSTPETSLYLPTKISKSLRPRHFRPTKKGMVRVRVPEEIPKILLDYFQMNPKTRTPLKEADRYLFAQVFMHEIEEGARLLSLAGQKKDGQILSDFSNPIYPSQRLDLLRRRLEELKVFYRQPERVLKGRKVRHNQCGALKSRLGNHPALAYSENGINYKPVNEDGYLIMPRHKALVVSDGMGGHPGGDVASGMAIDFMEYGIAQGMELPRAIALANQAILTRSQSDPRLGGFHPMGCTIAAIQIRHSLLKMAYVGDSKIIVVRGDRLIFETQDHTKGQELFREGLVDYQTAFELNHILSRCLGMDAIQPKRDVSTMTLELQPGDRIGLFTDGITDNFFDQAFKLGDLQTLVSQGNLTDAADCIMHANSQRLALPTLTSGSPPKPDNISLALIEYRG